MRRRSFLGAAALAPWAKSANATAAPPAGPNVLDAPAKKLAAMLKIWAKETGDKLSEELAAALL